MKKQGKITLIILAASAVVIAGMIWVLNKVVPANVNAPDFVFETEQTRHAALSLPRGTDTETADPQETKTEASVLETTHAVTSETDTTSAETVTSSAETATPSAETVTQSPETATPSAETVTQSPETVTPSEEIVDTSGPEKTTAPPEPVTSVPTTTTTALTTAAQPETLEPEETEEPEQPIVWDSHKFLTSNDPLHQIEITLDGYTVTAVGRYEGYRLYNMKLYADYHSKDMNVDIKEKDSGFEAVLYDNLSENYSSGFVSIFFYFVNDETMETISLNYRLKFSEDGLEFPDVREVIENNSLIASTPIELPEKGVREYICAGGSDEEIQNTLNEVKALSDKICAGITSEYEKLRAIASWVSENIYYDFDARDTEVTDETVCLSHLLETHRSICIGFTNLFTALCAAQDIECYNIRGSASSGISYAEEGAEYELHETAYAVIDGRRIWVDVVWNTWNNYSNGEYHKSNTSFKYFDITDSLYALEHWGRSCEHRDYFGVLQ